MAFPAALAGCRLTVSPACTPANAKVGNKVGINNAVNRALEYLGYPPGTVTAHDFRATASTRLHEMGYRPDIIELQLAHVEKSKTKAAYNHAQYLPERKKMMQEWADWVDSLRV